ncbi:hypothetical protein Lsan_0347 [Legionella santicrucis]|uniref:Transposase n=1 Tax=Legionella santicrucis TaxID=45074 RepID=A0A0W0ZER0_9GAMM|nr:hypothetical protein Lsan_0347 [Legionella santicrucis]
MRSDIANWEEILERYKTSGLTQVEFCKRNNLVLNHFLYRWHEKSKALKVVQIRQFLPEERLKVIHPSNPLF